MRLVGLAAALATAGLTTALAGTAAAGPDDFLGRYDLTRYPSQQVQTTKSGENRTPNPSRKPDGHFTWTVTSCGDDCRRVLSSGGSSEVEYRLADGRWASHFSTPDGVQVDGKPAPADIDAWFDATTMQGMIRFCAVNEDICFEYPRSLVKIS